MNREEIKRLFWDQYQKDLDSTLPEDAAERDKVQRVIRRYLYDHKYIACTAAKCGIWVDGWDAETRQPKVIVALSPAERFALKQYRHNTEGIPEEYYNVPEEYYSGAAAAHAAAVVDLEEEFDEFLTEDEVLAYAKEAIEPY